MSIIYCIMLNHVSPGGSVVYWRVRWSARGTASAAARPVHHARERRRRAATARNCRATFNDAVQRWLSSSRAWLVRCMSMLVRYLYALKINCVCFFQKNMMIDNRCIHQLRLVMLHVCAAMSPLHSSNSPHVSLPIRKYINVFHLLFDNI